MTQNRPALGEQLYPPPHQLQIIAHCIIHTGSQFQYHNGLKKSPKKCYSPYTYLIFSTISPILAHCTAVAPLVYSPILCPYRVQIMYQGIIVSFARKHEGADCQLFGTLLIVTFITLGQCNNLMVVAGIQGFSRMGEMI